MFDIVFKIILAILLPVSGAALSAAYFLGKRSDLTLNVLPRLAKKIEGDTEEKTDNDKKMGMERKQAMLVEYSTITRDIATENQKFIRMLKHAMRIPSESGEQEIEDKMREALGLPLLPRPDPMEITGNRQAIVREQEERLRTFPPSQGHPFTHDQHGAPVVPRPRARGPAVSEENTPPHPQSRGKPPYGTTHRIITGPHKVYAFDDEGNPKK